jgi:hypothetical protein
MFQRTEGEMAFTWGEEALEAGLPHGGEAVNRARILVLYGANATFTSTVMEHLRNFARYSRHRVAFCSTTPYNDDSFPDLSAFHVVVLHYSFFPDLEWAVPQSLEERVSRFDGPKLLYLQDEYDNTERARRWMERFSITCLLFACVPRESIPSVCPSGRFPKTGFRTTLTGYVPDGVADVRLRPLREGLSWSAIADGSCTLATATWRGRSTSLVRAHSSCAKREGCVSTLDGRGQTDLLRALV